MISLKEAGRYANFFTDMIRQATYTQNNIQNSIIRKTETHKRSSSIKDVEDEVKVVESKEQLQYTLAEVDEVINNMVYEKIRLSNAIAEAKKEMNVVVEDEVLSYDTAIEYAKTIREITSSIYGYLDNLKESVVESRAIGKTFNVEGNQVSYEYPVEVKIELLFDKNDVKSKKKALKTLANQLSIEIEEVSSKKLIDFDTEFDYLSTLEELIENLR